MNKEIEYIESMVEMGKMATANSLTYMKSGFEAMKKTKIPMVSQDGQYCYGVKEPYKTSEEIKFIVDFMITYLDEAIKGIDNQNKVREEK